MAHRAIAAPLCRQSRRLLAISPISTRCSRASFVVGSAASLLLIGSQQQRSTVVRISQCAASSSPPARFGPSIIRRSSHSLATATEKDSGKKNEDYDCPLCRKYSRGPCGSLFQAWLACTEQFRNETDATTGEELHLSKCSQLATPLAECLERNQSYYDSINIYMDDDDDELQQNQDKGDEELGEAWTQVVNQVEQEVNRTDEFPPHLEPILEIRPSTGTGMAAFVFETNDGVPLTMCYVKDNTDKGERQASALLAAGSLQDLWEYQETYGVLRLAIPKATTSVTAYALYNSILYKKTLQVPSTNEDK